MSLISHVRQGKKKRRLRRRSTRSSSEDENQSDDDVRCRNGFIKLVLFLGTTRKHHYRSAKVVARRGRFANDRDAGRLVQA